jgi:hypothetical protein
MTEGFAVFAQAPPRELQTGFSLYRYVCLSIQLSGSCSLRVGTKLGIVPNNAVTPQLEDILLNHRFALSLLALA